MMPINVGHDVRYLNRVFTLEPDDNRGSYSGKDSFLESDFLKPLLKLFLKLGTKRILITILNLREPLSSGNVGEKARFLMTMETS